MKYQILLLLAKFTGVFANTEKVVFVGPERKSVLFPDYHDILKLPLQTLSPQRLSLRTQLFPEFPSLTSKYGRDSWFLLNGVSKRQRFEVRVCWNAVQPTSFHLVTHEIFKVHKNLKLRSSLEQYLMSRKLESNDFNEVIEKDNYDLRDSESIESSLLLLQIFTSADYFTSNTSLMQHPLPVIVDVILDPYFLNVVPKSLIPTIAYILTLAISGWSISTFLIYWVQSSLISNINLQKKIL